MVTIVPISSTRLCKQKKKTKQKYIFGMNITYLVRFVSLFAVHNVRRSKLYVLYTYVYVNINKIILSLLYF